MFVLFSDAARLPAACLSRVNSVKSLRTGTPWSIMVFSIACLGHAEPELPQNETKLPLELDFDSVVGAQ